MFVDASGVGRLESSVVPQRVHRRDGSWADIDTNLHSQGGGFAPVASTADLTFSGGGNGPLVTWHEGGSTFELRWPSVLPAPRIEGDTAIYDNVMPDVNLHVTAGRDGFRHVLEVLTPEAAANPALRQIRYGLGGDMGVTRTAEGGLELTSADGEPLLQASPAVMWDSSISTGAVQPATTSSLGSTLDSVLVSPAAGDPDARTLAADADLISSARGPSELASTADVDVAVSADDLVLAPDSGMLSSLASAFPLFIDPAFSKLRSKWAYATSNGENNDTAGARVGLSPDSGALYRSYFSFDTAAMTGTTVLTAEVQMKLDHSYSCDPTWVHLYRTSSWSTASGGRLSWTARPLGSGAVWLDSWEGNANEAGGCGSIQPDADAVFEGSALLTDLKAQVQSSSSYWVGLCTCNQDNEGETIQSRWKKFYTDKTYLIATFDVKPTPPVGLAFTTTLDCYKQCSSPALVRSLTPTLRAQVQDRFGGKLETAFEVRTAADLAAPIVVSSTTMPRAFVTTSGNATGTATSQVPAGKLVAGTTYYWHATSVDEARLWSGWGPWYSFTIDTSPPAVSAVASTEYPQKAWGAMVGSAGSFAFTASGADEYSWDVDGGSATTTTSPSASFTPTTDMVHTLHVKAKDKAGNTGSTFDYQFWVSPQPEAYSLWTFDETDPAKTAADTGAGFSSQKPGTLGGTAHFVPGKLNNAVHLSGPPADRVTTSGPVLDTTKSFTVMAWVHAADLAAQTQQTILAQDGDTASRFELQYRKDANGGAGGWCFTMSGDSGGGAQVSACADGQSAGLPSNDWVHVAGLYDQVTGKMRAYVMGGDLRCAGEVAEADAPTSWSATGSFAIGRGWSNGAGVSYWRGDIDDARAYQRVLSDAEICQQASS
ncbi:Concanavalin A-like lectin/glucanases superfamily protein [Micromonospora avicenniae]|uniref:Concanavalin A-like lectin/glucanases superfamily protein n=1 Tax=Micromonospora avicenniae TaxID=1198245 RepID=A0A1N6W3T0_9ACTN|nr:Concanavalin A-like lectin/glucanases superfamily protein [Micromonospora avicenniae]